MTDNPKADSKQFMFSLIRLKPECKITPTFADFTPLFSTAVSTGSIIPIFNDDRCYYTHSFSLLSDKKTQVKVAESDKLYFEHRVRQSISSSTSAKIEELAPSSNYCQICKQNFKNYDQHLEQKTHILRCQHNQFNQDIRQLCHLIDESETNESTCSKRKFIKKKEKREEHRSAIKSSPKTTVDNDPKRKLSESYQQASFNLSYLKESFNI